MPTTPTPVAIEGGMDNAQNRKSQSAQYAREKNREVDRAATMMLLFPLTYILSIIPLATYRLASTQGHAWTK